MSTRARTTSWMWAGPDGMEAVKIQLGAGTLLWYDSVGCACGENSDEQPVADFLAHGPRYLSPPDDVLQEMRTALTALGYHSNNDR